MTIEHKILFFNREIDPRTLRKNEKSWNNIQLYILESVGKVSLHSDGGEQSGDRSAEHSSGRDMAESFIIELEAA
jgi:hypothetical protein